MTDDMVRFQEPNRLTVEFDLTDAAIKAVRAVFPDGDVILDPRMAAEFGFASMIGGACSAIRPTPDIPDLIAAPEMAVWVTADNILIVRFRSEEATKWVH